ncbi:DEP domain-containing protein DDB_G0279099-like [Panonychus citri]|uniref:DEP domain-containing protein DDB_G0279099-like n=1 Tax=Panonychus citri TaxID=50023 RepID=UPI002307014F|nr:DEP domain-containing protein DDB_G0279099-like [Panonychus citri]
MMQAPFTRLPQPVVCSICNKQYKDVHEHIEHMTSVHQMKASFRCSTCGEIFPSKVAVEAHLATHAGAGQSNADLTSIPVTAINLSSNNGNIITTITDNNNLNNSSNKTINSDNNNINNNNNGRVTSASSREGNKPSSSASSGSILSNIQVTRSACDAENVLALDIEEDEEEDGDDDLLKEVYSCSCGKAYFLRMSFDAHQKVCPAKMQQYSNTTIPASTCTVTRNQEANNKSQSKPGENVIKRPQGRGRSLGSLDTLGTELIGSETSNCRKMVEAIHSDGDTNCKACHKPMKGFISLCNHLSRRNECREFYNDNLVPDHGLEKDKSSSNQHEKIRHSLETPDRSNNSFVKSGDSLLHTKRALPNTTTSGASSTSSPTTVGNNNNGNSGGNTNSGSASDSKTGQGYSPAFTDLGPDDIIIAPSDELIRRAYLVRNRVQCPRCTKIFGGKTPAVAYNNHRRNKHCPATQATVPYLKAKFNKNKDQQSSPQAADTVPVNANVNPVIPQESKLPDGQAQVRFYCKLCPNRDIKNRVSLGVHLTTYHGLPAVNISSNDGIALRCQTCSLTFNSKYFYNMHRYECDLTSPYIGILEADKSESDDLTTIPSTESKQATNEREEETISHRPAPPPSIMPPPIQSISPTPVSPQAQQSTQHHRQQLSSNSSPSSIGSTPSPIPTTNSQSQLLKVQPTFNNPPRGSAVSNAYFGSNYTCTLCHKKGFPVQMLSNSSKYQCVKRPLVPPPKSPYPSPLAKPRTKSYSRPLSRDESQSGSNESRLAALLGSPNPVALNSQLKGDRRSELNRVHESGLLMCDNCGRGPYNSQYYLLEHKRQYCQVVKNNRNNNVSSPSNSSSSKSIEIENALEQIPTPNLTKTKDLSQRIAPSSSSKNDLIRPVPQKANHSNDIRLIIGNNIKNGSYESKIVTNKNETRNSHQNNSNNNNSNHTSNNKEPQDYVDMITENVPSGETVNLLECTECGFTESDVFKFVRHRLKHFSDKPEDFSKFVCYACEICKGKIVISQLSRIRQHLHQHLKIYKTLYKAEPRKEKRKRSYPFETENEDNDTMITCPYCRACQFSDAPGLSHHIKNACPFRFRCIKCDRTFVSKDLLVDHKKTCLVDEVSNNNSKTLISCHHCGLKFNSKQRLFYHEQACHKVYNADVSQRVEELIDRASTCAICGLRAKNYIVKAKHEVKCLEMALDSLGIKFLHFENMEDIDSDSSIVNEESVDQSSLISANGGGIVEDEEMEVVDEYEEEIVENICELMVKYSEEDLEESLRKKFGIDKDCSVVLERLKDVTFTGENDEDVDDEKDEKEEEDDDDEGEYDDYDEDCENLNDHFNKMESLKQMFERLLHRLVPKYVYDEIINGKPVDVALTSILQTMGSNPLTETNHKSNIINNFRTNIETFLQLSIEKEILSKASDKTRVVDEIISNLLNVQQNQITDLLSPQSSSS